MFNLSLKNENLLIDPRQHQRTIGYLGMSLPFLLFFGGLIINGTPLQSSLSAYYYTVVGGVFVGVLWAIGVFLFAYKGHERQDNLAGDVACICAIGVALFPTLPESDPTELQEVIAAFHYGFAGLFFFVLAVICGWLFTKTAEGIEPTDKKLRRNRIYRACAWLIIACLVGLAIVGFGPDALKDSGAVFWLESIAILAFGVSWFVKSEPSWFTWLSDAGD